MDMVLKEYIKKVKDNSESMLHILEEELKYEERSTESGRVAEEELEYIIEGRSLYLWSEGSPKLPAIYGGTHFVSCAMPIVSEGDIIGCVASLSANEDDKPHDTLGGDVESKLIMTAAGFLGKQLES